MKFLGLLLVVGMLLMLAAPVRAVETLTLVPEQMQVLRGEPIVSPIYGIGATVDRVELNLFIDSSRFDYAEPWLSPQAPQGWTVQSVHSGDRISLTLDGGGADWRPQGDPIVFLLGQVKPGTFVGPLNVTITSAGATWNNSLVNTSFDTVGRVEVRDGCLELTMDLQGGARRKPAGYEFLLPVRYQNRFLPAYSGSAQVQLWYTPGQYKAEEHRVTAQLCGLRWGFYELELDGFHELSVVHPSVAIAGPVTRQFFGELPAGDATQDNKVNILDFGVLAGSFGEGSGSPDYDFRADFDRNGVVNISDFGLIGRNFLTVGPVELDPAQYQGDTTQSHTFAPPLDKGSCRALLLWGWHSGLGGDMFISYFLGFPPDELQIERTAIPQNLVPIPHANGDLFFALLVVESPGFVNAAGILYSTIGVHTGFSHWFLCEG